MLICNAVLTDADGARPGDVRIENGVITAVGEGLSAGGDTVLDAQAAQQAGVDFAAVLNGTTPAEEFQNLPHVHIAPDLNDLRAFLGL